MNKGGLKGIKGFPQIKGDQINFPLDKEQRGTLRFFYPDFLSPDSSPNTISRSMQSSLRSLIPNKYADVDYKGIPEGNSTAINHTTVSMLQYKNPPKNAKYISQQVGKIVFGNGVFLATNSLAINISTNGVIWTTSSLALANTVAFGNGIFVAGTTTGGFLTSTDGTSWTTSASSQFPATSVNSIEYGNSLWTAVGLNGSINVSTDNGTTWTTRTSKFGATSFEITPKYDGNAGNAIYQDGKLLQVLSRGNGTKGRYITDKVKHNLPETIDLKGTVEIRGEVVIKISTFNEKGIIIKFVSIIIFFIMGVLRFISEGLTPFTNL